MWPEESEYIICACFAFLTVAYLFFVINLGKYAHWNPDPAYCMYIQGLETTAVTEMAARSQAFLQDIPVRAGYPLDIAHLFRFWFPPFLLKTYEEQ